MDKSQLVELLVNINSSDLGFENIPNDNFENKFEEMIKNINETSIGHDRNLFFEDLFDKSRKNSHEWKYLTANFRLLHFLNNELLKSEMNVLSVQETKNVKSALQNVVLQLILKNIQPNLPYYVPINNANSNTDDILFKYDLLKNAVIGFHRCLKKSNLRMLILPHCLRGILVATFQLGYCSLKKPEKEDKNSTFTMTGETYRKLLKDQELFRKMLEDMSNNIHREIFIKETMVLLKSNAPLWFKKAVSNLLTKLLMSKKGVRHVASAMLDSAENDTTKTWKVLDILTKLIISCQKSPDFQQNICTQILDLLRLVQTTDHELYIFERLFISCTKSLFLEDEELCKTVFVSRMTTSLSYFVNKEHDFYDGDDLTDEIKQTGRLIYGCFASDTVNLPCLPIELIKNFINVIFHFYHLTVNSSFRTTNKELGEILIKYLQNRTVGDVHGLLDNFLFGFTVKDIWQFRSDVILEINEKIVVTNSRQSVIYTNIEVMDSIFKLFSTSQKIILFSYLLKCISNKDKYLLIPTNNQELLKVEDNAGVIFDRLLMIHKLLTQLVEDKEVQLSLKKNPGDIIEYMDSILSKDSTDSEIIFIIVMILDNLVTNSDKKTLTIYKSLIRSLVRIAKDTSNFELKCLCNKVLNTLNEEKLSGVKTELEPTDFQKALEDVSDPLLPTRGHALLALSKLVQKKDKEAMERKQYLLNLFQLHLKNEDSYIYLNAVKGLAALADVFTDTILETLCEEYVDFSKRRDGVNETRMKLGEVLVTVVKRLGEMAPKYKTILLNTFLSGTKDDDHLIRSSSLSNLGEVCRVLNYKLGTIVTEILVCVHSIITTDKAVEARRAAVTVIRQLFVGLQSEMINFLKKDLLPIYRTLKEIYYNDKDDVMRLQAQVALEELNENMKNFIFPNPQLHTEKKVIMLE